MSLLPVLSQLSRFQVNVSRFQVNDGMWYRLLLPLQATKKGMIKATNITLSKTVSLKLSTLEKAEECEKKKEDLKNVVAAAREEKQKRQLTLSLDLPLEVRLMVMRRTGFSSKTFEQILFPHFSESLRYGISKNRTNLTRLLQHFTQTQVDEFFPSQHFILLSTYPQHLNALIAQLELPLKWKYVTQGNRLLYNLGQSMQDFVDVCVFLQDFTQTLPFFEHVRCIVDAEEISRYVLFRIRTDDDKWANDASGFALDFMNSQFQLVPPRPAPCS